MGQTFEFTCPSCGYQARAPGGPDRGMRTRTTTIVCLDCREISDVITVEMFASPTGQDIRRRARCEQNSKHKVRSWRTGGPCPRCGTAMGPGEPVGLWD